MDDTPGLPRTAAAPRPARAESSLDPERWEHFRVLAHRMLDEMLDLHRDVRQAPVWRPLPEAAEESFRRPLPRAGIGIEAACERYLSEVLPYRTGNVHPRFWGWVSGTGTPAGLLAETLAAGGNFIGSIFNDGSARVERQVVDWLVEGLGYAAGSEGVFTSGGSVGNLMGLVLARDASAGWDVPGRGLDGTRELVFYASAETHSSIAKAAQVIGLGRRALRTIGVDAEHRIRVDELRAVLARDRAAGRQPIAIVANAGTVNTGAIDDLAALAEIAEAERLWLHVDGAFGALAALSPKLRPALRGLERADSVAFDFHKWMYVQYEAGCLLVRDGARLSRSFSAPASYLEELPRGIGAAPDHAGHRTLQLSRGFKALKVWLQVQAFGIDRYAAMIEQNVDQVAYLAERIREADDLEIVGPVPLNVICFRYAPSGVADRTLDEVNRELLMRLQESGEAAPSSTRIEGKFVLRVANVNQRSRRSDFDHLLVVVRELGEQILASETQR